MFIPFCSGAIFSPCPKVFSVPKLPVFWEDGSLPQPAILRFRKESRRKRKTSFPPSAEKSFPPQLAKAACSLRWKIFFFFFSPQSTGRPTSQSQRGEKRDKAIPLSNPLLGKKERPTTLFFLFFSFQPEAKRVSPRRRPVASTLFFFSFIRV